MKKVVQSLGLFWGPLALAAGCGDSLDTFPVSQTSGVVLCDGEPVQAAMVFFTPVASGNSAEVGKPGFAFTDAFGRYVLSAYGDGDGAVIGRNKVRVTTSSEFPCACVGDEVRELMEVEITADGPNEFEIELPHRDSRNRPAVNPFDDPVESDDPKLSAVSSQPERP